MARRSFSNKVFNEHWDNETKLALFWLLANADGFGMQKESPGSLGDALRISRRAASDCIERLIEDRVILPYGDNSCRYFVFRKWQDYQSYKYAGKPTCPYPPTEILAKLSIKTQEYFHQNSGGFYENVLDDFPTTSHNNICENPCGGDIGGVNSKQQIATANSKQQEGGVGETEAKAALAEAKAHLWQVFAEGYEALYAVKPERDNVDFIRLAARLKAHTAEEIEKVIRFALSGNDGKFGNEPPSLSVILSKFHWNRINGLLNRPAQAPVAAAVDTSERDRCRHIIRGKLKRGEWEGEAVAWRRMILEKAELQEAEGA